MLEQLTAKLAEKVKANNIITATVRFEVDSGVIIVDPQNPDQIVHNNADVETQCVINVSDDDLNSLMDGDIDASNAFMMGKLKVSGDMSVAIQLNQVLKGA